ncbi:TetR/AcrR family transcriptional regulator [Streptomyces sp. NBC_01716]|uniref:TetR/AcrR family transcriptional regulator n=1 Tax=Streptomyces sp. NBC_01716 TaxID=2975917 RepID=UPI002E311EEE|nr:TetR family transcriptional regulator [Streptomyces sp. NBC_01716]
MLIKVAGELFNERAFDAVTTEMIGSRAGVTGPALYRHFPSKQALLIAVLEDPLNELLANARRTAAEISDPRQALEAMIDYHVRRTLDNVPSTLVFLKNEHNVPTKAQRTTAELRTHGRGAGDHHHVHEGPRTFPVRPQNCGVLVRAGHTAATADFSRPDDAVALKNTAIS